ncbi:YihY/virulence factor BrkB family protein [Georgenia sp. AZ-5]|uniref:YihY/virulence factor BrkB family protein n=1 Tax=Georgenia sp. AZ-5 TaxID=3367526 RepID=UPI0037551EDA
MDAKTRDRHWRLLRRRMPGSPTELPGPTWRYAFKRAVREFLRNQLTDKAAALTFYSVLSLFPALIACVSILGVVGQGQATTEAVIGMLNDYLPDETARQLEGPISGITENTRAGLGLVIGLLIALWTASNYVNAFSRAMNSTYEVPEGRPIWKLRPMMYAITAMLVVLGAVAALILVVSGPVARWVGDLIGLGATAVAVWDVAKWPVLVVVAIVMIAVLYYFTPNARMPEFRWISPGAALAIVVAGLATAGFGFYVANFGRYNATYGALAGIIIFLLWLWIMNVVLLFGAEFDAELERARELEGGLAAEEHLQLPPRDTTKSDKDAEKYQGLVEEAHRIRTATGQKQPAEPGTR